MAKEVDINKVLIKLVDLYKENYSHNPLGVLLLHLSKLNMKGSSTILALALNKGIEITELEEINEKEALKAKLDFDLIKELKLEKIIDELELKEEEIIEEAEVEKFKKILQFIKEEKEKRRKALEEKEKEDKFTELVSELKNKIKTVDVEVLEKAIPQLIDLMNKNEVKYILLKNMSIKSTFHNLIRAINFLAQNGWECLGIYPMYLVWLSGGFPLMFALMKRVTNTTEILN